jgi:ABC-type amino acid transport substrate-binding protein/outer membrane protein OmpA-like peptidoglycan-associated protein
MNNNDAQEPDNKPKPEMPKRPDPLRPSGPVRGQRPLSDLDFEGMDALTPKPPTPEPGAQRPASDPLAPKLPRQPRPDPLRGDQPAQGVPKWSAEPGQERPDPAAAAPRARRSDPLRSDPLRPEKPAESPMQPPMPSSMARPRRSEAAANPRGDEQVDLEDFMPPSAPKDSGASAPGQSSGPKPEENRFSLHRRFSKPIWIGIVVSQLVLAGVALGAVRAYFRDNPNPQRGVPTLVPGTRTAPTAVAQVAAVTATAAPQPTDQPTAVPTLQPTAQPAAAVTSAPAAQPPANWSAGPAKDAPSGEANPFFGPNYAADGKPAYVCAASSDAQALTLQQIQVSGLDIANGFHLGIVPLGFDNAAYAIDNAGIAKRMAEGSWQCAIGGVEENAELNMGVLTAIVGESAGADGIWTAGDLANYEALAGKRLGALKDGPSAHFVRHVLSIMTPEQRATVALRMFDTPAAAHAALKAGEIDAVTLSKPQLRLLGENGLRPVVSSRQLRVLVDGVITSRESIAKTPDLVKAFHTAWFAALKEQFENPGIAAKQVAAWGNGAWTGVSADDPVGSFNTTMRDYAQATADQNAALEKAPDAVIGIIDNARVMWFESLASAGQPVPTALPAAKDMLDFSWSSRAAQSNATRTVASPINATFSLRVADTTAQTSAATITQDASAEVAVLPCRTFTFLPDSVELTEESRRVLDTCVTPVLKQRNGLVLLVRGSAAWPGPKGTYSEDQIRQIGEGRAQAIIDYLVRQDIAVERFRRESVLPPSDRRDSDNPQAQAQDRWVEMTLFAAGR